MVASELPAKIVVVVGTYDGVIAGWEVVGSLDGRRQQLGPKKRPYPHSFKISFATPVHGGSVRCLALANHPSLSKKPSADASEVCHSPGSLLSCGYDEVLRTHDLHKHLTSSGEIRFPADENFGTPACASFAPPGIHGVYNGPPRPNSSHCILGFAGGKIAIYKKRDWSVQHVLPGHDGGVASIAVHPTGKLALTGGSSDGRIKLWDLTKGRLAYATRVTAQKKTKQFGQKGFHHFDSIDSMVWTSDGEVYGFAHGSHVTVRHATTGRDLLDVELPTRVNQMCFIEGPDGIFVAVAGNDGSLPVLSVQEYATEDKGSNFTEERRAIMAIEPVDGPVAAEERIKCIHSVTGYFVVTANSAGVISLMNLSGAVRMILLPEDDEQENSGESNDEASLGVPSNVVDTDFAVDIIASTQLGTGARVTCLVAWALDTNNSESRRTNGIINYDFDGNEDIDAYDSQESGSEQQSNDDTNDILPSVARTGTKRKQPSNNGHSLKDALREMDPGAVSRARALVEQAKKIQRKSAKKKNKKRKSD